MTTPDDNTTSDSPPVSTSQITITFPNGTDSTLLSASVAAVSPTQLELAGHFLLRQAEKFYRQAEMHEVQQQLAKGILAAPQGFKVDA